jgi:hypothetical protein
MANIYIIINYSTSLGTIFLTKYQACEVALMKGMDNDNGHIHLSTNCCPSKTYRLKDLVMCVRTLHIVDDNI